MEKWHSGFIGVLTFTMLTINLPAGAEPVGQGNDLQTALKAAAHFNPSVKSKIAELKSLGYKLDEAEAGRLPSFSISAQSMYNNDDNYGIMRGQMPLYSFGKISGNIKVAEEGLVLGKFVLLQVQRQLIEDTAAAYNSHWGIKQRVAIAEANVAEHDRLYQMINRRQQGGVASAADVRLALSRLLQAQAQLDQIKGAAEKARNELEVLTQLTISADTPIDQALAETPAGEDELQKAQLIDARVKVRMAELAMTKKEADLRQAERMPTLYVRYDRYIKPKNDYASDGEVGVVLEGSLDGLGIIGQKRAAAAKAHIAVAEENLEDTRNEIKRRVTNLLTERGIQGNIVASYERSTEEMEETLKSVIRQFDAGRKSWIDVLNFQRELTEMRHQLLQAKTNWLEVSLRLAAINGRLDTAAEVKEP
ncbi:MAG: TolC family protein [Acidaminococcaceae bacterium]